MNFALKSILVGRISVRHGESLKVGPWAFVVIHLKYFRYFREQAKKMRVAKKGDKC